MYLQVCTSEAGGQGAKRADIPQSSPKTEFHNLLISLCIRNHRDISKQLDNEDYTPHSRSESRVAFPTNPKMHRTRLHISYRIGLAAFSPKRGPAISRRPDRGVHSRWGRQGNTRWGPCINVPALTQGGLQEASKSTDEHTPATQG